ncbi:MAG: 8-oxo-dGTP pyrophosphatase MutT (NUDIX family) [Hyphomicrobiaceae bacterium]|jgi:8-oxo-dGTP pyrophosphatase MutT (NUDIX family)
MLRSLDKVRTALAAYNPSVGEDGEQLRASVAVVLRNLGDDTELLFIRRALCEGDPWSGHIAFPGGRLDPGDAGPREAAERETLEEVGLELRDDELITRLDDLTGEGNMMRVSAYLYGLERDAALTINHEVESAFWVSLVHLTDEERQVTHTSHWRETPVDFPAVRILEDEGPVLWGMTYRFVERFLAELGYSIPSMTWPRETSG